LTASPKFLRMFPSNPMALIFAFVAASVLAAAVPADLVTDESTSLLQIQPLDLSLSKTKFLQFRVPADLPSTINLLEVGAVSANQVMKHLPVQPTFKLSCAGGFSVDVALHAAEGEIQSKLANCSCAGQALKAWSHSVAIQASKCPIGVFHCLGECPTSDPTVVTSMRCQCAGSRLAQTTVVVSVEAGATEDHVERGKAFIKALKDAAPTVSFSASDENSASLLEEEFFFSGIFALVAWVAVSAKAAAASAAAAALAAKAAAATAAAAAGAKLGAAGVAAAAAAKKNRCNRSCWRWFCRWCQIG